MNYTIHLTNQCNLRCRYCYHVKNNCEISFEIIKKVIDYQISRNEKHCLINFFGGEPLLKKDLIKQTIEYVNSKSTSTDFYFGMTTNGTLIDNEFIDFIRNNEFSHISYSIDGIKEAHDINRIDSDGNGSFQLVQKNARKLIDNFDSVIAMPVIAKNNLKYLSQSVQYLIDLGFKKINLQFNYRDNWEDKDLETIREQLTNVTEIYANLIQKEENINIFQIDNKIASYISKNSNCKENCTLGLKSINVGTDGKFYPCVQFVGNEKFAIGNCNSGINEEARACIIKNAKKENSICKNCTINRRCNHTCACINYMLTNDINELSPIICETERIMVEIADKMAERLYKNDSSFFIQKYYNKNFDILNEIANKRNGGKNGN